MEGIYRLSCILASYGLGQWKEAVGTERSDDSTCRGVASMPGGPCPDPHSPAQAAFPDTCPGSGNCLVIGPFRVEMMEASGHCQVLTGFLGPADALPKILKLPSVTPF